MSQLNVLIIDDSHDLADGLGMVLEEEGFQVTLAYNGCDGIEAFEAGRFDVAFIDVKMPDISGVEVFHKIRKKDPELRIIMMTGYRVKQLLEEVVGNGDVEILRKPLEIGRVLEVLAQIQDESIILVVDDDPEFAHGLSACLTEHGMKTMFARNGQEAVDGVLSNPVDVLVLDFLSAFSASMPSMPGNNSVLGRDAALNGLGLFCNFEIMRPVIRMYPVG
ncbi:MAG: response regulator [Gammaproteobacteria bacterium]|nr:response regulator [Gammaproteobacteria bacterium]